jgi:hypothetical protein
MSIIWVCVVVKSVFAIDHFTGYYFMYAGLGLDTNSISGHNNRHTWSTYHFTVPCAILKGSQASASKRGLSWFCIDRDLFNTFNNDSQVSIVAGSTQSLLWCKGLATFQDGAGNSKMVWSSFLVSIFRRHKWSKVNWCSPDVLFTSPSRRKDVVYAFVKYCGNAWRLWS